MEAEEVDMSNGARSGNWKFYVAGAGAGAFVAFIDFMNNTQNGTVAKMGAVLDRHLFPQIDLLLSPNFWAILLIVLVSIFVCWVYEVESRLDAFLRGCSILAAFSIGAPDPSRDNSQPAPDALVPTTPPMQIQQLQGRSYGSVIIIPKARAANALAATEPRASVGEITIVLSHLAGHEPAPESTVEVKDRDRRRVALFQVKGDKFRISQPYGRYLVSVDTRGFAVIRFHIDIDRPIWAYSVDAQASSIPIFLQKLARPEAVVVRSDEAEAYKQIGRQRALKRDFEGALANYRRSLERRPDDSQTLSFMGYALYRLGHFADAEEMLRQGLEISPDSPLLLLNLAKAQCGQGEFDAARETLNNGALAEHKELLRDESELLRACAPIIGSLEATAGVRYYVAVSAFRSKNSAISQARRLSEKGYDARVYFSTPGFYRVTVGPEDAAEAQRLLDRARSAGDAPADAYLTVGRRFTEQVFPN